MTTTKASRVLLLELNELSPVLLDRFIGEGRLPTFAQFRRESHVHRTTVDERYPYLDPWIQWATAHAGVPFSEHGIAHLNQGHTLKVPNVWDVLEASGHRTWICGSMSMNGALNGRGARLPDPWTTKVPPTPASLMPYFKFVQTNVLEHTNARIPLSPRDYAAFVAFMVQHGLSRTTVKAIAAQLAYERLTGRGRWRRATLLDQLQLDVFQSYFERERPAFSTYFSNSTAHYQHLYWRNMEPHRFASPPSPAQQRDCAGAIRYGYEAMDRLLARIVAFAGRDTVLVFATAISQVACTTYEAIGGKSYYRPRDFAAFARAFAMPHDAAIEPVMAHEFSIELAGADEATRVHDTLARVVILGRAGLHVERRGNVVFTGCRVWEVVPDGTRVDLGDGRSMPFYELFYKVDGVKSGMHDPEGILWIRRPDAAPAVFSEPVPLTALAPTILDMFGVAPPPSMATPPLAGHSKIVA